MKVLVISAAYPPMHAGEATNTYHLCRQLVARGLEVHVLTSCGNLGTADPQIHVHAVMQSWGWADFLRVRSFLKNCAPDAVFLMYIGLMYKFHPMVTFLPTLSKKLFPKMPFVTRYESAFVGADPSKMGALSRAVRKLIVRWAGTSDVAYSSGTLLRDSDTVIALCERHRAMLVKEWESVGDKIALIPPPPNLFIASNDSGAARERGRKRLGVTSGEFVVTFLDTSIRSKGLKHYSKRSQSLLHGAARLGYCSLVEKLDWMLRAVHRISTKCRHSQEICVSMHRPPGRVRSSRKKRTPLFCSMLPTHACCRSWRACS